MVRELGLILRMEPSGRFSAESAPPAAGVFFDRGRRLGAALFLVLAWIGWPAVASSASPRSRPNILFILADDLGWQDTSVDLGPSRTALSAHYRTPAIARLATEGMKFTQAYSCTVCSPARVSLMTGLSEARHGVTNWLSEGGSTPTTDLLHPTLSPANWNWNGLQPSPGLASSISRPVLPALLKQAGYRTLMFGKGHLGAAGTPGADPKLLGFDVRVGGRANGAPASYQGKKNFGALLRPNELNRVADLDAYWGQDIHLTEALTLEATREVRAAVAAGEPFFCYFAHYAPHLPIEPDERFAPYYRSAGLDQTEAAYASLIAGMDKSVGDLLALLDELGVADNTIVVFTSDNGALSHRGRTMEPPFRHNAPLSSGKGSHHEGGLRVPLFVRWPAHTRPGAVSDVPVIIYDWMPTLLEIGQGETPPDLDGVSLVPLFHEPSTPWAERALFWHFPNFFGPLEAKTPVQGPGMGPSSTLRRGDWKLIHYYAEARDELFNLAEDLGETRNLAQREPARVRALALELTAYLEKCHSPMPVSKATSRVVPYPAEALAGGGTHDPAAK